MPHRKGAKSVQANPLREENKPRPIESRISEELPSLTAPKIDIDKSGQTRLLIGRSDPEKARSNTKSEASSFDSPKTNSNESKRQKLWRNSEGSKWR